MAEGQSYPSHLGRRDRDDRAVRTGPRVAHARRSGRRGRRSCAIAARMGDAVARAARPVRMARRARARGAMSSKRRSVGWGARGLRTDRCHRARDDVGTGTRAPCARSRRDHLPAQGAPGAAFDHGHAGSGGMPFDALWIAACPRSVAAVAATERVLPVAWQRERGVPRSSAARELDYGRALTGDWSRTATYVVMSHPTMIADQPSPASALIPTDARPVVQRPASGRERSRSRLWRWSRSPRPRTALAPGSSAAGPARSRPRATARSGQWRSIGFASSLARRRRGIEPSERGQLVHAAMAAFWAGPAHMRRSRHWTAKPSRRVDAASKRRCARSQPHAGTRCRPSLRGRGIAHRRKSARNGSNPERRGLPFSRHPCRGEGYRDAGRPHVRPEARPRGRAVATEAAPSSTTRRGGRLRRDVVHVGRARRSSASTARAGSGDAPVESRSRVCGSRPASLVSLGIPRAESNVARARKHREQAGADTRGWAVIADSGASVCTAIAAEMREGVATVTPRGPSGSPCRSAAGNRAAEYAPPAA